MSHSGEKDWDFDSIPLPPHSIKKYTSYAFSCDHSMAAFSKMKPLWGLQWFPGHLQIPTLYCSPCLPSSMAYSLSLSHLSTSDPFFSLSMLCLCFSSTLSWVSRGFSRSSSSKMELLLLLPKMPSLSHCSITSIRFDLSHFVLFTLRLSLVLFAYFGIFITAALF